MTVTAKELETKYTLWFYGMKNTEDAKKEILRIFSEETDEGYLFTEQDILSSRGRSLRNGMI